MKTITTAVYTFDELSDAAKDRARDWYRNGALDYDWWDSTYEDAERAGLKLTSFDLDRNRHACGEFMGGATETADKIMAEHGPDCETRKTAEAFLRDRDAIVDGWERDENGDHIDVPGLDAELDECEAEFLRSILEDYSILLQREYEYLLSDECVDELILANEYTFDEDGKRFG